MFSQEGKQKPRGLGTRAGGQNNRSLSNVLKEKIGHLKFLYINVRMGNKQEELVVLIQLRNYDAIELWR